MSGYRILLLSHSYTFFPLLCSFASCAALFPLVWSIFSFYLFSSQISNCSTIFFLLILHSISLAFFFILSHTFCWHSQSFIRLFFFLPSLSMCLHSKLSRPYIYEFVHKHIKFSTKTTIRKQHRIEKQKEKNKNTSIVWSAMKFEGWKFVEFSIFVLATQTLW